MEILNAGKGIPLWGTKDPDADIWFVFRPKGLESGESLTSYTFLINNEEVTNNGATVDGLVYEGKALREDVNPCVRLSGGMVGTEYKITLRYSTDRIPSDDKSFNLLINHT